MTGRTKNREMFLSPIVERFRIVDDVGTGKWLSQMVFLCRLKAIELKGHLGVGNSSFFVNLFYE